MTLKIKCVSDAKLMKIPIKECGEKLVNLKDYSKEIIIEVEEESKRDQNLGKDKCFVRESVAIMLSQTQSLLPDGLCFKIIDGFRPMQTQRRIYSQVFNEIKSKNPGWNNAEVEVETDKWVGNPKIIPPHTTGGAVDLTIVDRNFKELDFGTKINTPRIKSATQFKYISEEAKRNRRLLVKIMKSVGFVNYPLEWWHWSYGDRIWAFYKKKISIYNSVG